MPMEKYGVEDRDGLIRDELAKVRAERSLATGGSPGEKTASARQVELQAREAELLRALADQ